MRIHLLFCYWIDGLMQLQYLIIIQCWTFFFIGNSLSCIAIKWNIGIFYKILIIDYKICRLNARLFIIDWDEEIYSNKQREYTGSYCTSGPFDILKCSYQTYLKLLECTSLYNSTVVDKKFSKLLVGFRRFLRESRNTKKFRESPIVNLQTFLSECIISVIILSVSFLL